MSAIFFELPNGELFNLKDVKFFEGDGKGSFLYLDPVELNPAYDPKRQDEWSKPFDVPVSELEMLSAFRSANLHILNLNYAGITGAPIHVVVENIALPLSAAREGYKVEEGLVGSHIHFTCGKRLMVRQTPEQITNEIRVHSLAKIIPFSQLPKPTR